MARFAIGQLVEWSADGARGTGPVVRQPRQPPSKGSCYVVRAEHPEAWADLALGPDRYWYVDPRKGSGDSIKAAEAAAPKPAKAPKRDAAEPQLQLNRLCECFEACGPNGRGVMLALAERMAHGAALHGDFADGRNWAKEGEEEFLDGMIYYAVEARKRQAAPAAPPAAPKGQWISGDRYLPAVGERVRVIARRFSDARPYAGNEIEWPAGARTYGDEWLEAPVGGDGYSRLLRVAPLVAP